MCGRRFIVHTILAAYPDDAQTQMTLRTLAAASLAANRKDAGGAHVNDDCTAQMHCEAHAGSARTNTHRQPIENQFGVQCILYHEHAREHEHLYVISPSNGMAYLRRRQRVAVVARAIRAVRVRAISSVCRRRRRRI